MPKLKKPPKNAYMFFMQERKLQLEREGHRFPRGFADVADYVQGEWKELPPSMREKYEKLAKEFKEKEKLNLDNKFTATGESYSSVQRRMKAEEDEKLELRTLFRSVVYVQKPEERIYFVMKATAACEVGLPQGRGLDKEFYPLELAVAAFSLKDGFVSSYWSLVDTVTVPCGYASAAKETSDETLLPQPGSRFFQNEYRQARDYGMIINKIRKFIETWGQGYPEKIMVFAMASDIPVVKGCLDWLVKKCQVDQWTNEDFFNKLKYFPLPELVVELSVLANTLDPTYTNEIVQFQLSGTAETLLKFGNYDYKEEITCQYHKKDDNSQKMHLCCQNIILRRIFLMLEQLSPAFKCQMTDRHRISLFFKSSLPDHLKQKMISQQQTSKEEPGQSSSHAFSSSSSASRSWVNDDSRSYNVSRASSSGTSESSWQTAGAKRSRSPYDEDYSDANVPEENFSVPWGAKKQVSGPSLLEDDFPPLAPSVSRGRGIRPVNTNNYGPPLGKQEDDDDDALFRRSPSPPPRPPMGRGLGGNHRRPAYGKWN